VKISPADPEIYFFKWGMV